MNGRYIDSLKSVQSVSSVFYYRISPEWLLFWIICIGVVMVIITVIVIYGVSQGLANI